MIFLILTESAKGVCLEWVEVWRMTASIRRLIRSSQVSSLSLPIERRVMTNSSKWRPLFRAKRKLCAVGNLTRASAMTFTNWWQKSMSTAWTMSKLFVLASTQQTKSSSAGGVLSVNRTLFKKKQKKGTRRISLTIR